MYIYITVEYPLLFKSLERKSFEFPNFYIDSSGLSSYYVLNIRDEMNLKHLVVITGCDSGLGYSLALHCRDLGATVMAGVLEPTGKAIENLRSKGVIVELLDLTDDSSIKEFGLQVRNVLRDRTLGE